MRAHLIALVIGLLLGIGSPAARADTPCSHPFTPAESRSVYEELRALGLRSDCRLADFRVDHWRIYARWTSGSGADATLTLVPKGCAPKDAPSAGEFARLDAAGFEQACPETAEALDGVLSAWSPPFGTGTASSVTGFTGRIALGGAFAALLAWVVWWLAGRRWRAGDHRWYAVAGGGLLVAAAVRLASPPALANWYTEVASSSGATRFGPVAFAFQEACSALLPWSDRTLTILHALVGAMVVPLFVMTLRAIRADLRVALAAAILLSLAPLHVRVSASPSEHVLSAALTWLALFLWASGERVRHWLPRACALCVIPAAALTRVDTLPQLLMIPLWGLLAARGGRKWRAPALYFSTWGVIAGVAWHLVIVPSKHPFPPPDAFWSTTKALLTQFWTAAVVPPGWFSLIATLLGVLGIAYALRDRRWMLGALLASLALCFIPIGRNLTTDGLVGSRYFQAAIPVALTLSGLGFAAVCDLLTGVLQLRESALGRHATRWVPAVLGVALTAGAWWEGQRAMAYRYAFQDEYSFLRDATSHLEDGCTVLQLPLRRDGFERDLDCCLDAPRSPLVIANPGLRWRYFEPGRGVPADSNTCVVYYEGAACSLADIAITRERNPEALRWFRQICPSVLDVLSARPLEESSVSPESTTGILGNERVRVRLYWVRGDAR